MAHPRLETRSELTQRERAARERAARERSERVQAAIKNCEEVQAQRETRAKVSGEPVQEARASAAVLPVDCQEFNSWGG